MSRALEEIYPGHEKWCSAGLRGARLEFVQSIMRTGLSTQFSTGREKRSRIHMAAQLDPDGREQPGLRQGSTAAVAVDLDKLHQDGVFIYVSVNNVIPTAGVAGCIPPQYLRRIIKIADGRVLWPLETAPLN
eukprot:5223792-Alexandrium_andersonii.AAC.1